MTQPQMQQDDLFKTQKNKQTKREAINEYLQNSFAMLFHNHKDAADFVSRYRDYIHCIDDLIDDPFRPSSEAILSVAAKAAQVFSTPYWRANAHFLFMVEQLSNNTYADSVKWEGGLNDILKRDAAVLRHTGVDMFFAVIYLEFGRDVLRQYSTAFREHCHVIHINERGEFI